MNVRYIYLIAALMLIHCSESSNPANAPSNPQETSFDWHQVGLSDTTVFSIEPFESEELQNSGGFVAFTGFEVFVGNQESVTELEFLRNRTGFAFDSSDEIILSYQDSSIWKSSVPYNGYEEVYVPAIDGAARYWQGSLFYVSDNSHFITYSIAENTLDTLISNQSQDLQLVDNADNYFFLRLGNQIKKFDFNQSSSGLVDSNLPVNSITSASISNSGSLLVGTERSKAFISANNGETWQETWPELIPSNTVTDIEIADSGEIYLSILGSGIYFSEDDGQTWQSITLPSLDFEVYDIGISSHLGILAATGSGVYQQVFLE